MSLSVDDFLEWAFKKEPTLSVMPLNNEEADKEPAETPTISALKEAYNNAYYLSVSMSKYIRNQNYRLYLYNYALHLAIVSAVWMPENDNDMFEEPTEPLQKLYVKYGVINGTIGITTSSSSGGSSAGATLPRAITEGDLETSNLLLTPYGRFVETVNEQLVGVVI